MAWWLESFLNEAETATKERPSVRTNGTHNFGGEEKHYKRTHSGKLIEVDRASRDVAKAGFGTEHGLPVKYANHVTVKDNGSEVEHDSSEDRKKYMEAKKWAKKQLKPGVFKKADPEAVAQAADAKARHDRRHGTNESTDMLVEIMQ